MEVDQQQPPFDIHAAQEEHAAPGKENTASKEKDAAPEMMTSRNHKTKITPSKRYHALERCRLNLQWTKRSRMEDAPSSRKTPNSSHVPKKMPSLFSNLK
jgi:hypothetical protein